VRHAAEKGVLEKKTRTRSTKLYGLLASLVHGKTLNTIKSIGNSDRYEALRQMILSLRPNNNNRGLTLLTAATSWPAFSMGFPLQPEIVKLEEAFEESRKAGTEMQDAVKAAILMRCVTGQLRAYVNLGAQDNMQYHTLQSNACVGIGLNSAVLDWYLGMTKSSLWKLIE
jgi:hypothetical protein